MRRTCSARYRREQLEAMEEGWLDVLIVGSGPTGSAVAWEAAGRGMKVGLIEENDFSSWNSSYMGPGWTLSSRREFKRRLPVYKQCMRLVRLAPHIVKPIKVCVPYYRRDQFQYWKSRLQLALMNKWNKRAAKDFYVQMEKRSVLKQFEPSLESHRLKGGVIYSDVIMDPMRLCLEWVKGAYARGALVCNYAEVAQWYFEQGKVNGAMVIDKRSGKTYKVRAKLVVNTSGPRMEHTLQQAMKPRDQEDKYVYLDRSFFTLLCVQNRKLRLKHAISFPWSEGWITAVPASDQTHLYVQRQQTEFPGASSESKEWIRYMLYELNRYVPDGNVYEEDIHWLRNLHVCELDQLPMIHASSTGLLSVEEAAPPQVLDTAEAVVDAVAVRLREQYGYRGRWLEAKEEMLPGGGFIGRSFEQYRGDMIQTCLERGIPKRWAEHLLDAYGSNAEYILSYFREISEKENMLMRLLCAEVLYAVEYEMAASVSDFFLRRAGLYSVHYSYASEILPTVTKMMGELLEWDNEQLWAQYEQAMEEIKSISFFADAQKDSSEEEVASSEEPEQVIQQDSGQGDVLIGSKKQAVERSDQTVQQITNRETTGEMESEELIEEVANEPIAQEGNERFENQLQVAITEESQLDGEHKNIHGMVHQEFAAMQSAEQDTEEGVQERSEEEDDSTLSQHEYTDDDKGAGNV